MDCLEKLFLSLWEEKDPVTLEFEEIRQVQMKLGNKLDAVAGDELVEKWLDIQGEYLELKCRQFFHSGVRLGVELLKL